MAEHPETEFYCYVEGCHDRVTITDEPGAVAACPTCGSIYTRIKPTRCQDCDELHRYTIMHVNHLAHPVELAELDQPK